MQNDYYETRESVAEYIELAKDVSGKALIERFREFIPEESEILELGSGPGTDWKILSQYFKVTGSDFSMEFLKHLKTKHHKGTFLELDAITLETERHFDGIYSNKVLHHLKDQDLKSSVKRQLEVLNPGGVLCHSFWNGEGSESFKGMFVNYHDESSLRGFFSNSFDVLLLEAYREFEDGDSLLMIARKK